MLDEFLIRHSAPTLAGLKTANLFWYPWVSREEFQESIEKWQEIFRQKGLGLAVIRENGQRALLYVYRTSRLWQELQRKKTRAMLEQEGYTYSGPKEAIEQLKLRLCCSESFPHEIGLFLGYPEEDVEGFIENQGKNCKCCGCWKVYCNEWDARKTFCKYKKCERVYQKLFSDGKPVWQLIVAITKEERRGFV